MLWQWSLSVIAELVASATMLVLAIYFPWRDLNRQARLTAVTLIFFCSLWILSHAIEIGLPVATLKESMVGLQLVLGMMALTFWLFYIFHYLGPRKLLSRRIYILFGIMPLIAIIALSTNNIYGLMWTEIGIDSQNPYLPLEPSYGIIYWACMAYFAVLTLTGSFLIIWSIFRRRYSYSRESIYLLLAAVLPLIVAFIEVLGLLSFLKLSVGLSSWAGCIGAIILILNLPRFHLEQVIPVARDIIFERIGDCILVLDKQNRVLDLNPGAEQLTGYKISDAFGLQIEQIWPYQSDPVMPFNKMVKTGEELVIELEGKQRTYDPRISTISDAGGRLISQVILLTDITERKQAKIIIEKQREEYRTIFDTVRPMIAYLNKEGVIQRINKAGANTFGLEPKEIVGKTMYDFFPTDEADWFAAEDNLVMTSGKPIYGSIIEYTLPSGEMRWAQVDRIPYIDEQGHVAGVITVSQDITRRKLSEEKLVKSYESIKKTLDDAINTMVKIVELRDPYTAGHQQRVADLAIAIARGMKLEDTRIDQLRTAAVIHDIGKMYVPTDILSKPGKLSDIEFSLIKTHSQSGFDIVKSMDLPCSIANTVLQHHERLDGSGYPNGLKHEDTLLEAKMLAVADVVEAMASHRPYRQALGIDQALDEISKNKGKLYDSDVVDTCLKLFKEQGFKFEG